MDNPKPSGKRPALNDISNEIDSKRWSKFSPDHWFPLEPIKEVLPVPPLPAVYKMQNVHPALPFYQHDLDNNRMSHDQLASLLQQENELKLVSFLQQTGILAKSQQCKFCGSMMKILQEDKYVYWVCYHRVNGKKCNRGRYSVRKGTFFDHSKLSIQNIMWIVWHYVHNLSEKQCREYTNIGQKNKTTIVQWYGKRRTVANDWIRKNPLKLGGFGKIVEMDESHFAGAPKYGKGRRLGDNAWEGLYKWTFGLTERGSLDCILETVDAGRSRKTLMPIINNNCLDGTVFCSDSWKAYYKLPENIDLEDVLYFPVNHTNNYVDPVTGAHTQSIEGLWRHAKEFLPSFGMRPDDLQQYLGSFMWFRFCKQRKLDMFVHMMKCISEEVPPAHNLLPAGKCEKVDFAMADNEHFMS